MLVTLQVEDTMGLTSVFAHVGVDEGDNIVTDRCGEHGGHVGLTGNFRDIAFPIECVNAANWSDCHSVFV